MPYNKDTKYLDRYNIGTTFIAFDYTYILSFNSSNDQYRLILRKLDENERNYK